MTKPTIDDLFAQVLSSLPSLNEEEQKVSIQLYHLLAQGNPVSPQQLTGSLQLPVERIRQILDSWWGIDYDDQGRVIGYWGLTLKPTQHRFDVADKTLYTWCAWDTLFIPGILNKSANITSTCPVTNQPITLKVSPKGIETVYPADAIVSFITPDVEKIKQNVVNSFCHYVYFFTGHEAGNTWCLNQPQTFLMPINDAFMLGQRVISAQYPNIGIT
jgi:alkylmercury lyase